MQQLYKDKQNMVPQFNIWQLQGNQNIPVSYYTDQTMYPR